MASSLEQMGVACWELHLGTGELWWSENAGPLLGRPRGYIPADFREAEAIFHPDDERPRSLDAILSMLASGPVQVERRAFLPDGSVRWTEHRYFLMGDGTEQDRRLAGMMTDVDAAKRRELRQRLLAEASAVLTSSLDSTAILDRVGETLVPAWADWCVVHLVDGEGLRPVVVEHRDEEKVRWAEELLTDHPVRADAPTGVGRVVRERQPELVPIVPDETLEAVARDERHLELLRTVGFTSVMTLPLIAGSEVLGAMSLVSAESKVRFDEEDLRWAEDLAARLAAALANARLHERATQARDEASRTAERLRRLQEVTSVLSEAYRTSDVVAASLREMLRAVGTDKGVLLLADDAGRLSLASAPGYPPERLAGWTPQLLNSDGVAIGVFRRGSAAYLESSDQLFTEFPEVAELTSDPLGAAWAAVPIVTSEGPRGVLAITFDRPHTFTAEERDQIEALARQTGIALERARLFESQRQAVDALQRGLMPEELPTLPGIVLAAHYEIGGLAKVGGDWYDAFSTEAGEAALVIGDVAGRGIPAVAAMARLRNALKALLMEGHPPDRALSLLNRLVSHQPGEPAFATAVACLFDPARGTLRWSSAGHVPAMLREGSSVRWLGDPVDVPIGALPDHEYRMGEETVDDGALLVLYTDGLVERRGEDIEVCLRELQETVAAAPDDPAAAIGRIVAAHGTPASGDDVAVLVVRLGSAVNGGSEADGRRAAASR